MKLETANRARVLFIAGSGRSGSTLVASLCGQLDGAVYVGEAMRYLFRADMQARIPHCSCGTPARECPFWKDLLDLVEDRHRIAYGRLVRLRRMWRDASDVEAGARWIFSEDLLQAQRRVLEAIMERSGAQLLVDSSKHPATGALLSRIPGARVDVLHLVRDPRGVVASWSRPKGYLLRHGTLWTVGWWMGANLGAERLARLARTYRRARYEDWARDPARELGAVAAQTGTTCDLSFLEEDPILLRSSHALAGNPGLSGARSIRIKARQWRLTRGRRLVVTLLTCRLLARYGYTSSSPG